MAATSQMTVGAGADTAVVVQSPFPCKTVTVYENLAVVGFPTTDYLIRKVGSSIYTRIRAGQPYDFTAKSSRFVPGQIVGFIKTAGGSTTFDQDEDQA